MTAAASRPADATCTKCGQIKPVSDFYSRAKGKPKPYCKDCDNTRARPASESKLLNNRARHRAVEDLIARHRDEFEDLLALHRLDVKSEAARLTKEAAELGVSGDLPRLRPGQRKRGQTPVTRLDVGRCTTCARSHDRGHVCPKCGAAPPRAFTRPDDGVVDEVAIERACDGHPIQLTPTERTTAVRHLASRGIEVSQIAKRLHMHPSRVGEVLST